MKKEERPSNAASGDTGAISDVRVTPPSDNAPPDFFATTKWSVIVAAGIRGSAGSESALQELCRTYWPPLYAFARRHGRGAEDAEDLTQGFFARMLSGGGFEGLDRQNGRFRAFLLAAMKHFLANEWDKETRLKRGGGAHPLSLDLPGAEALYSSAQTDAPSPDKAYDRAWAITLLERVIKRLRSENSTPEKAASFESLKDFLTLDADGIPYANAAEKLCSTPGATRVAVHRLRKRYRELLRSEIADTLTDTAQVDDELRALFESFAS